MANPETISASERRIRTGLPILRWMQSALPISRSQRLLELSLPYVRMEAAVSRKAISADGVACEWIIPLNCQLDKVLLYLHGGGFVFGLTPPHLKMAAWLAKKMAVRVLMVNYRLAPDYPYPAPLEDCVTAYTWLLHQGYPADSMVIAGDSAGGNLTITTMMKLRDDGLPLPAAAACLSPVTDFSEKDGNNPARRDPLLPPKAVKFYTDSYVGDNDRRDPLISPVLGNLTELPPLLVHVGEEEILREDAVLLVERAKACGVDAHLEVYPRMWHVFQLYLSLPQAKGSLSKIAEFLALHLGDVEAFLPVEENNK